jgi:hypothetical protein
MQMHTTRSMSIVPTMPTGKGCRGCKRLPSSHHWSDHVAVVKTVPVKVTAEVAAAVDGAAVSCIAMASVVAVAAMSARKHSGIMVAVVGEVEGRRVRSGASGIDKGYFGTTACMRI